MSHRSFYGETDSQVEIGYLKWKKGLMQNEIQEMETSIGKMRTEIHIINTILEKLESSNPK